MTRADPPEGAQAERAHPNSSLTEWQRRMVKGGCGRAPTRSGRQQNTGKGGKDGSKTTGQPAIPQPRDDRAAAGRPKTENTILHAAGAVQLAPGSAAADGQCDCLEVNARVHGGDSIGPAVRGCTRAHSLDAGGVPLRHAMQCTLPAAFVRCRLGPGRGTPVALCLCCSGSAHGPHVLQFWAQFLDSAGDRPQRRCLLRFTCRWGPSGADPTGTSHFSAQVWDCSAGGGSGGAGRDRRWGEATRPSGRSTEASPIRSGRFGVPTGRLARARAALAGSRLSWRLQPPPGTAGTRPWRAGKPAPRWRAELPLSGHAGAPSGTQGSARKRSRRWLAWSAATSQPPEGLPDDPLDNGLACGYGTQPAPGSPG
jgi:hypothetical protein